MLGGWFIPDFWRLWYQWLYIYIFISKLLGGVNGSPPRNKVIPMATSVKYLCRGNKGVLNNNKKIDRICISRGTHQIRIGWTLKIM